MVQYLTNIDPTDHFQKRYNNHEIEAFKVRAASIRSGQNVKYLTCPMPGIDGDYDYRRTVLSGRFNHFGCIVGFDRTPDYTKFWEEYDKIG